MEEPKEKKDKKIEENEMSENKEDVSEPIEKNSDNSKKISEEESDAKEKNSEPEVAIVEEEKKPKHEHKHEHKHHEAHKHHTTHKKESATNTFWPILSAILLIAVVILLVVGTPFGGASSSKMMSEEQVKVKAQEFINTNLLQPGTSATITNVELKNGLYDLTLEVNGKSFPSQMTTDGKIFFVQPGIVIDEFKAPTPANAQTAPAAVDVPKTDKPVVDLFVMSQCPYGTQIEKGMLPVVDLLGKKADVEVKFVNYAMHGKKEIDENTNQYCIQQEYPDQYYAYLQCYLKEGDTASCVEKQGFDQTKLNDCIAATDKKFDITANFEDKASWNGGQYPKFAIYDAENKKYGVRGSPTLVINGQQVSVGRDSNSLKNAICNAFSEKPEECATDLPSASPSPGFGFGTSATDSAAANCGV